MTDVSVLQAMIRHKSVCDYLQNYANHEPGSDRSNLTVAHLLMPEEYTGHKYTSRLTTQVNIDPLLLLPSPQLRDSNCCR